MKRFVSIAVSAVVLAGSAAYCLSGPALVGAKTQPAAAVRTESRWVVDKSHEDPTLVRFLRQLNQVVQRRDAAKLLTMVDDHVKSSFGIDHGKPTFVHMWHLKTNAKSSPIWRELHDLLALGGDFPTADHLSYMIPYLFLHFPAAYSEEQYAMVVGSHVNVRAKPNIHAEVIANVSDAVVRPVRFSPVGKPVQLDGYSYRFMEVTVVSSGVHGYVCEKYVQMPLGWRMGLRKAANGQWRIAVLVRGD